MASILRLNKDVLRTLCDERNISYPGKSQKLDLVEKLFTAVSCKVFEPFGVSDWPFSLVGLLSALMVLDRMEV